MKYFAGNAKGVQPTDQREGTSLCARDERSGIVTSQVEIQQKSQRKAFC